MEPIKRGRHRDPSTTVKAIGALILKFEMELTGKDFVSISEIRNFLRGLKISLSQGRRVVPDIYWDLVEEFRVKLEALSEAHFNDQKERENRTKKWS